MDSLVSQHSIIRAVVARKSRIICPLAALRCNFKRAFRSFQINTPYLGQVFGVNPFCFTSVCRADHDAVEINLTFRCANKKVVENITVILLR